MTRDGDPDMLKTALAAAQIAGAATGVDMHIPGGSYLRGRTAEHKAEVARLAREHQAMLAGIDRYQHSRSTGHDDKVNEIHLTPQDPLAGRFTLSQGPTKQG